MTIGKDKKIFRELFKRHFNHSYLPTQTSSSHLAIVKPRQGEWGRVTFLVETSNHAALEVAHADPTSCVEDYDVGHRKFSLHVLFDQGRLLYSALSTYDHELDGYVRGIADHPAPTNIEERVEIPTIFHDFLTKLNYSGTANIDYKLDETGQINIFKVNPRMGGSLVYLTESYITAYSNYINQQKIWWDEID